LEKTVIPNIYKQKYTGNENIKVDGNTYNFNGKDLSEIEDIYKELLKSYTKLIQETDAKKSQIRKITKLIKKTSTVQQNLLKEIYDDESIVYSKDAITYDGSKVKINAEIEDFFGTDFDSDIISSFYDKDEEGGESGVAINLGNEPINISNLNNRLNKYLEKFEELQDEQSDIESKNNLDSGATLSFMYLNGETIEGNTSTSEEDKFSGDGYKVRRVNYTENGTEETATASNIDNLSYSKLLKHYLLIDYVVDNYSEKYGDDLYVFFEVINNKKDEEGVKDLEEDLFFIYENKTICCKTDGCPECGSLTQANSVEENIKVLFSDVIISGEDGVDALIQAKREEEKENQPSQNTTENNESPEEKLERERKAELESIMKWAMHDVSQFNNRYETEAEYFSKLKMSDPFTYKNLVDKFKYFNPAFHAITPEGFNARLTFLQQCTRQGATSEMNGIGNGSTSNNLAFGRMPVCVLRIGDFIHTKVIIQSISINYGANGAMQWDLNPEGTGVQPMYAKISMNIVLIGGQSLETPISRLQNALSFNYYANAESYDNRADSATYNNNGDIKYNYVFDPMNQEEVKWGEESEKTTPAEDLVDIETTNDNEDKVAEENQSQQELDKASGVNSEGDGYKKGRINRPKPGVDKVGMELYGKLTNVIPSNIGLVIQNSQENIIIEYEINTNDNNVVVVKSVDLSKYQFKLKNSYEDNDLNYLIEVYKKAIIEEINNGETGGMQNDELIKRLIVTTK